MNILYFSLSILVDTLISFIIWGLILGLIGLLIAKIIRRPKWHFLRPALWIALAFSLIGSIGGNLLENEEQKSPLPSKVKNIPEKETLDLQVQIETARKAHRKLQHEVFAQYSLILKLIEDSISYDEYMMRSAISLRACRTAESSQSKAILPLARYKDDPSIKALLEAYTLKSSQVHCLEEIHNGIELIGDGAEEEGLEKVKEYDSRFTHFQKRYEKIGTQLLKYSE